MTYRLFSRLALLLAISLLIVGSVGAVSVPEPEGVFYYQPASAVIGSESVWINPAAIGSHRASGFQLMADINDGDYARSWGALFHRERFSLAYRNLDRPDGDIKEYVVGYGFPVMASGTYLGVSYNYYKDSPGVFAKRNTWNVGLLGRSTDKLAWAATFSNLNRDKIEEGPLAGEKTDIEQRYSLAYRPKGNRLTLAVDMSLSTRTRFSNADYVYHLEAIPTKGLFINGYIDSDSNFEIGFRANLLKYFVGTKSSFTKNGDSRVTTAFVGATNMRQPSIVNESRRRLVMSGKLGGRENPPQPVFGRKATPFVNIIGSIYRAAEDPSIGEITIDLKGVALGFGQAQEFREALRVFKSRNKRAICYLGYPNNLSYYIASVCDSVLIPPVSQLNLIGLRAELTFYAGLFDKIGASADIVRIGDHKTAPERYTNDAASDENREQINRLLDRHYEQFVEDIARGRRLSPDSVKAIIDNGPYDSDDALKYGLVDGLCYRDELREKFTGRMPEVSFRHYKADTLLNRDWGTKPAVGVVVAEGEIKFGRGGATPFSDTKTTTPASMRRAFCAAINDPAVKAIVLRINSPGGYALAGEDIHRVVTKAAEKKPVVVSMANIAASGGYYIAMPAEHIFADRATVTGSIGIYGGKPDLSKLYEKLDVGKELYTRGKFAGMLSWTRPFTDEEREKYQSSLENFYHHFLRLVSDNRGISTDSIDALSRGRVWTGDEAISNGLIDEIGGLKAAMDYAAALVEVDNYTVRVFPEDRPLFLLPGFSILNAVAKVFTGDDSKAGETADLDIIEEPGVYARMPFDLTIE